MEFEEKFQRKYRVAYCILSLIHYEKVYSLKKTIPMAACELDVWPLDCVSSLSV